MKKLHLYILKSFAGPFIATFFLVLFFLLMQFFWLYVDDLIGKGLSTMVIAKLLYYISFTLVPMALPLAILLSSIMTFGNLAEQYELAAMKSAGVSLYRIMRPLFVLMGIMTIGTYFFANYAVPYANFKSKNLLYNITHQKPSLNIKEGMFNTSIPGYSIRVGEKSGENEEFLSDIIIYDHSDNTKKNKSITAKEGLMEIAGAGRYLKLTMIDGYMYEDNVDSKSSKNIKRQPFTKTQFEEDIVYIDISSFNMDNINNEAFSNNYAMMNNKQLNRAIDSLKVNYDTLMTDYSNKFHARLRYPALDLDSTNFEFAKKAYALRDSIKFDTIVPAYIKDKLILSYFSDPGSRQRTQIIDGALDHLRSLKDYAKRIDDTQSYKKEFIAKHIMEVHRKFSFSYIVIVMFFVGAPLGAIIRKGGLGMPVVVAIVIFISFHVLSITTEKLGLVGTINPVIARWIPPLVLTPFGILLTRKATTDSAIFNSELYFAPLYKLLGKIKSKKEEYESKRSKANSETI